MNEQAKRDLLAAFAAAWGRADVEALMALMTDDCVYKASVGPEPGTTYSGADAVRRGFTEILAFEADGEQRSGQVWFSGDYAFAEWAYDEIDGDGKATEIKGIDVFHFVDNKLRLKDAYRKTRI